MTKKKIKKRCKAIRRDGKRCTREAILGDYCVVHYKMMIGINYITKKPKEDGDKNE